MPLKSVIPAQRKERVFKIKFENHLGSIEISQDYFANLVATLLRNVLVLPEWSKARLPRDYDIF